MLKWDSQAKRTFGKWLFFIIGFCLLGIPMLFKWDLLNYAPFIGITIEQILGALALFTGYLMYQNEW